MAPLRIGFSSCPNDTFMFDGLINHRAELEGSPFDGLAGSEAVIADIETLNRRAVLGEDCLEITKLSIPALAATRGRYRALRVGAALGRGCGPLVVTRRLSEPAKLSAQEARNPEAQKAALRQLASAKVAIPGRLTTANALLSKFAGEVATREEMGFEAVMPAVAARDCDAGLIIHESRFTYADHGLRRIADLGELWEADTGLPLPLGVICIREDLDTSVGEEFERALAASIDRARANPSLPRPWIRELAQEMADEVCDRHIALYVNDESRGLSSEGARAVELMLELCRTRLVD